MQNTERISYWEQKSFFKNIDFLIIGAGIVGYSTALHLRIKHKNAKIVILEKGYLPSGASSKNAGFACFGSATELYDDLQRMNENDVWETVELRWKGLKYLRSIVGDDQLKLQINGSWDLVTEEEKELFEGTIEALPYLNQKIQSITGEEDVYSVDSHVSEKFGLKGIYSSIYNRLEGQIDTASMNKAFYNRCVESDIQLLFGIEALSIEEKESNVKIITNHENFQAKKVAICTNGFAGQFLPEEDISPARAQVLVTHPIPGLKIKGTFHYNCGYYYFRNIDNRILFGGGRNIDFEGETSEKLELTDIIQHQLQTILDNIILPNMDYTIDHAWAGIMGVGSSKKPIIKNISDHVCCGVRLGGMGVAIGTLVGKELSALMT